MWSLWEATETEERRHVAQGEGLAGVEGWFQGEHPHAILVFP